MTSQEEMDFNAITSPTQVAALNATGVPPVEETRFSFLDTSQSIKCLYQQSLNFKEQKQKDYFPNEKSNQFHQDKTPESLTSTRSAWRNSAEALDQSTKLNGQQNLVSRIKMPPLENIGYRHQRLSNNEFSSQHWSELVLISYQAQWEDRVISDMFLWPKSNRSVPEMKMFALNFLAEHLGNDLNKYECHQAEWSKLETSQGSEHMMSIVLDICWENYRVQDKFLWDISNPDNSPEEFAFQMTADQGLPTIFNPLISLQIRRQISNYCLKCAQTFKEGTASQSIDDFQMPITFFTIKPRNKKDQIANILPLKRTREEIESEDTLAQVGKILSNKQYQPKMQSHQQTPKKTKLKNMKTEEGYHDLQDTKNGNKLMLSDSKRKKQQLQCQDPITLTLQKNHQGLYSIVNEAQISSQGSIQGSQVIKISLGPLSNSAEKLPKNLCNSSGSTVIKIPVNTPQNDKELAQVSTHHSNDSSSSKITLDLKNQSPLTKQKGFDGVKGQINQSNAISCSGGPIYASQSHLIQIDLKNLYVSSNVHSSHTVTIPQLEQVDQENGIMIAQNNSISLQNCTNGQSSTHYQNGHL